MDLTHLWVCQICKKQSKTQEDRMVTELLCQHLKCRSCFISETNGCLVCQKMATIEPKSVVTWKPNVVPDDAPKDEVGRRTQTKRLSQIANQLVVQKIKERCEAVSGAQVTRSKTEQQDATQKVPSSQVSDAKACSQSREPALQFLSNESSKAIGVDQWNDAGNKLVPLPLTSNTDVATKRKLIAKEVKHIEYGFNANGELYKKRAKPRFVRAYECVYCNRRFFNAGGMGNHIKYIHRDLVMRPKMTGDYGPSSQPQKDEVEIFPGDKEIGHENGVNKHFREINIRSQELHNISTNTIGGK